MSEWGGDERLNQTTVTKRWRDEKIERRRDGEMDGETTNMWCSCSYENIDDCCCFFLYDDDGESVLASYRKNIKHKKDVEIRFMFV